MAAPLTGLALLRAPFTGSQISKLPKESKAQVDERKADRTKAINCQICGGWHHKNAVHLNYVGHAALTDRLLDVDPNWTWEPVAFRDGLPAFDATGGLWIKLTICGVTRLGYGHAAQKQQIDPGAREKEVIGDALRNAGMRFGAALELWHKGSLHDDDDAEAKIDKANKPQGAAGQRQQSKDAPKADLPTNTRPAQATGGLKDRADAVENALRNSPNIAKLQGAYNRASGVCAALDTADPERLAEIEALYQQMEAAFMEQLEREPA